MVFEELVPLALLGLKIFPSVWWRHGILNASYIVSNGNPSLSFCLTSLFGLTFESSSMSEYITLPGLLVIIPSFQNPFPLLNF